LTTSGVELSPVIHVRRERRGGVTQMTARTVNFFIPNGSIGLEAIFSRVFVGNIDYIRRCGIDPVMVFANAPANGVLKTLIKRKLDGLSIRWVDHSDSFVASKLFARNLKTKGYKYYDAVGYPHYFDKNKRYVERLAFLSAASYADGLYLALDFDVLKAPDPLQFIEDESSACQRQLEKFGVKGDFVCIHPRDDKFHGTFEPQRNIPLERFDKACEYLASQGIMTLKMGINQEEPAAGALPSLINYAKDFRSELLDIWLIANARFYLGSNSGLFYVAYWFDTPVAIVNYPGVTESTPLRAQDIYLPQKIWSKELKRILTFREIADGDIGLTGWGPRRYEAAGLEPITSTSKEVEELAIEMHERVGGSYRPTAEDLDLQFRFRRLFKPSHAPFFAPCSVGRDFLRNNLALLN
jgi:putative glycosyltransferase (TIGR04372 family)